MPGITYRYYTEKVQFPFGFGLSYTTFKYSDLKLSSQSVKVSLCTAGSLEWPVYEYTGGILIIRIWLNSNVQLN